MTTIPDKENWPKCPKYWIEDSLRCIHATQGHRGQAGNLCELLTNTEFGDRMCPFYKTKMMIELEKKMIEENRRIRECLSADSSPQHLIIRINGSLYKRK